MSLELFIDTHCHLDFKAFDHDRDQVIHAATKNEINYFVVPSITKNNFQSVIELANKNKHIIPALGLHPCFIDEHNLEDLSTLESQLIKNNIQIIGEIGLDKRIPNMEKQIVIFEKQIILAKKLKFPVIIHSVKTHAMIIEILKNHQFQNGGIIHAFNGSYEIAIAYLKLGFKLGIGSLLTNPKSKLLTLIPKLPFEAFVLESDSPDMPIFNATDKRNTPLSLITTFDHFYNLYSKSKLEIKKQLWHNSLTILKLNGKLSETPRFI